MVAAESRLDSLYTGELIAGDAYDRACALRRDGERVSRTGSSIMARFGVGAGRTAPAAFCPTEAKLDAARRLTAVRARLSERDFAILLAVCVEDVSWPELGRRLHCSDKTAKRRATAALERLAGLL